MKAVVYKKFGPPEVLCVQEIVKPKPKENEVLIRVYASTVAAEDPSLRKYPGMNGIFKPKNPTPGWYLAGEVEAVGDGVKEFKPNDKVYGSTGLRLGANAQYICLPEKAALALMPVNLNYQEAAAIPNGALTALPFFRDTALIKKGQKVLVYGASGTVGSSAVQFAKYFETKVTGVCSSTNLERVKALGADAVIDYRTTDFTEIDETWDVIFDTVGKLSFSKIKHVLTKNGVYLTTFPTLISLIHKIAGSSESKTARFAATGLRKAKKQKKDLYLIKELVEQEIIKPVIDRVYSMEQIADAHAYVEKGHKKGDVVINCQ